MSGEQQGGASVGDREEPDTSAPAEAPPDDGAHVDDPDETAEGVTGQPSSPEVQLTWTEQAFLRRKLQTRFH